MRPSILFLSLSLVGCGRLGFGGLDGVVEEPGSNDTVGVEDSSTRAPYACESVASFATTNTADVDLSIATTPSGASVFWVPTTGGSLRGFDVAADRSASNIVVVRSGPYDRSAAAYIDGHLIATVRTSTRAVIHDVPMPLAAGVEIGNFWGDNIPKLALLHAGGDRVMAASCSEIALHAFDSAWQGTENSYVRSASTSNHLDTTPIDDTAFTVVSTDMGCVYETATDRATSVRRTSPLACEQARVGGEAGRVAMAFVEDGTVAVVVDDATTVTAANAFPVAAGSSPRVLQHGGRTWMTYLDENGKIVVGYLDAGMLLTRTLGNTTTMPLAYELAVYDGQPWVFGVDPTSMNVFGHRLCEGT